MPYMDPMGTVYFVFVVTSLPETNSEFTSENGWLEDDLSFWSKRPISRGKEMSKNRYPDHGLICLGFIGGGSILVISQFTTAKGGLPTSYRYCHMAPLIAFFSMPGNITLHV